MSRRRLLTTVRMGDDAVRIYRDPQWDCYVIVTAHSGTAWESEESSLQAARDTAAAQCRWIRRQARQARRQAAIRYVVSCVGLLTSQRLYWRGAPGSEQVSTSDAWTYAREDAYRYTDALVATDAARKLQRTTHVYVTVEVL